MFAMNMYLAHDSDNTTDPASSTPAGLSGVERIARAFRERNARGRLAFMPFVSAGDPDIETTGGLVKQLAAVGADLIEIGFPYSDPIADGPIIQASYTRALNGGLRVAHIFHALELLTRRNSHLPPLVGMVAYALVFRMGLKRFISQSATSGLSGLIIPDLPGDEAEEVAQVARSEGLALIPLVAPTTPISRLQRILQHASGFVYCISVAGTTGVRDALPHDLPHMLARLRPMTSLPLAVGFGIGHPDRVSQLRSLKLCDGAIVGSALVKCLAETRSIEAVAALGQQLAQAAHDE